MSKKIQNGRFNDFFHKLAVLTTVWSNIHTLTIQRLFQWLVVKTTFISLIHIYIVYYKNYNRKQLISYLKKIGGFKYESYEIFYSIHKILYRYLWKCEKHCGIKMALTTVVKSIIISYYIIMHVYLNHGNLKAALTTVVKSTINRYNITNSMRIYDYIYSWRCKDSFDNCRRVYNYIALTSQMLCIYNYILNTYNVNVQN